MFIILRKKGRKEGKGEREREKEGTMGSYIALILSRGNIRLAQDKGYSTK